MKESISSTLTEIHNHLRVTDDKRDKLASIHFWHKADIQPLKKWAAGTELKITNALLIIILGMKQLS